MSQYELVLFDLAAILVLTFGIYFRRHQRRDMVVAFVGMNVGIMSICRVLTSVDASVGIGIGLFGVLSIIRLRSDELDQREVAYYFAALALGLLGGTRVTEPNTSLLLSAAIVLALWASDHPMLLGQYRIQHLTLDHAWLSEADLRAHLADLTQGDIRRVAVKRVDLVNDTTQVEVRYRIPSNGGAA